MKRLFEEYGTIIAIVLVTILSVNIITRSNVSIDDFMSDLESRNTNESVSKEPATAIAPTAINTTYNGSSQVIANAGSATGGTIYYGLGSSTTSSPSSWSINLPSATNAGTYYIWYRVIGDSSHSSISPTYADTATVAQINISSLNLTGIARVDETLTTSLLPTGATATYRWYRDDTLIDGATSSSYTLTSADVSHIIKCIATGSGNYKGSATAQTSGTVTSNLITSAPITVQESDVNKGRDATWYGYPKKDFENPIQPVSVTLTYRITYSDYSSWVGSGYTRLYLLNAETGKWETFSGDELKTVTYRDSDPSGLTTNNPGTASNWRTSSTANTTVTFDISEKTAGKWYTAMCIHYGYSSAGCAATRYGYASINSYYESTE